MKYNFTAGKEWDEIETKRECRLLIELNAARLYIEDNRKLLKPCQELIKLLE